LKGRSKRNVILITVFTVILLVSATLIYLFVFYNKTVATADGTEVKQKEVDAYMNYIKNQSQDGELAGNEEELKTLEADIIDLLIVTKLLEKYAEEKNITVSSQEVDEQVESLINTYESEKDFESALKIIGIDRRFFEEYLRSQMISSKIYEKITANIEVTDQEARKYYNDNKEEFLVPVQIKASHILAVFPWAKDGSEETEEGREEARDKIEMIQDKLEDGEDFEDLAQQYSDDQFTAENGGDMGYIKKGEKVEEFDRALFLLEDGETSGIVETALGFHIIKAFDHKEEYYQDYEEIEESLKTYLLNLHKSEEWIGFVYSLIEKVDVKYFTDIEGTLDDKQEEE
jgi:foldase protein PrsA